MQVNVEIAFDQLLKIVKALPAGKLKKLRAEIEKGINEENLEEDLETLLLNGPIATSKQIEIIEQNRNSINQLRKKL
jgi:hypothetical protein